MEFDADGVKAEVEVDETGLEGLSKQPNHINRKYEDAATNLHREAFLQKIKGLMGDMLLDAAIDDLVADEDRYSIDWHERRQIGLDWYKEGSSGSVPRVHPDEYYEWLVYHLGLPTKLPSWEGIIRVTAGKNNFHVVYGKDGMQVDRSTYLPE